MAESNGPAILAAFEGLGSITMCGCGVVTLHVGDVSLRMEITAFTQLETMMREASEDLLTRARLLAAARVQNVSSLTH